MQARSSVRYGVAGTGVIGMLLSGGRCAAGLAAIVAPRVVWRLTQVKPAGRPAPEDEAPSSAGRGVVEHHAEVLRGGRWTLPVPGWRDLAAMLIVVGFLLLAGISARQMAGPLAVAHPPAISLSPAALPGYTLRTDFLDLWDAHQLSIRSVLMVTHNIEEVVLMCDRILVLGAGPAHIEATLSVPLPRPRSRHDPAVQAIVGRIYATLTARIADGTAGREATGSALAMKLPDVSSHHLAGFVDTLAAALHLLAFAEWHDRTIRLSAAGHVFAQSDDDSRRRLFSEHVVRFGPLAAHIDEVLGEREGHRAPRKRFELELEDHLDPRSADQALRVVTDWGRYAGLFDYDDHTRTFGR